MIVQNPAYNSDICEFPTREFNDDSNKSNDEFLCNHIKSYESHEGSDQNVRTMLEKTKLEK